VASLLSFSIINDATTVDDMGLLYFLLLALSIVNFGIAMDTADIGPFCLFPRGFSWQASLDKVTGRGSSREVSYAILNAKDSTREARSRLRSFVSELVADYPNWLAQGGVTLGLLRAVNHPKEQCTSLEPRLINFNILSFGTVQIKNITPTRCVLELPIVGGLLALPAASGTNDRGCLKFVIETGPRINGDIIPCELRTEIAGNYCPWIAGYPPVPLFRKWTYLSTQSPVHAYCMWRFHRTWKTGVKTMLSDVSSTTKKDGLHTSTRR
jgi:hypothetical protein